MTSQPAFRRLLSLGAGVQSSTLLLLAAEGRLPDLDGAIFADTGWEPAAVYTHLDRLEREVAEPAGIPIYRVSAGNIRNDALDPKHKFVSLPTFTINADGSWGMGRRQCTKEYKLVEIKRKVRRILGYPHPTPVPRGVYAEQWIGISRDEIGRAKDSGIQYLKSIFPLLDLDSAADGRPGWTRTDCMRYLRSRGFKSTPKSACIGCPFHGNKQWREMRDNQPAEWADAVAFDYALRAVPREDGIREYLHVSRLPLDQAPIDRVSSHEQKLRQTTVFDQVADALLEQGDPDGCSPWSCRSGQPVTAEAGQ
ncbi:adenine nucleotide alpha hydrolase family protein [Streptomyces flaveolus]|uniref:hypothetical protein n=1 Tax=Streptomyces flaveolus TaxID=67297 RepID=UPI0019C78F28|nr:hypothetical protein [Streptomyces flaveolus]GGQ83509.1 hypothetical protein GCM10010216_51670 [Streptomyces flaveolus]